LVALANQLSVVAFAAGPAASLAVASNPHSQPVFCTGSTPLSQECVAKGGDGLQVSLPDGGKPCPGSEFATCEAGTASPAPTPGVASTPEGQSACGSGPAACTDTRLAAPDAVLASQQNPPSVSPSVPIESLIPVAAMPRIQLSADAATVQPDKSVRLIATASASVTGTSSVIEIFDQTTGTLAGSCAQGSQCIVAYAAKSGPHTFAAFLTPPTSKLPVGGVNVATSNAVTVSWMGVSLVAKNPIVGPGRTITLTATSTARIDKSGYELQLFDANSKARLASCNQGINCSVSLTQSGGGVRSVVAVVAAPASTFPNPSTQAKSDPVSLTWLTASIEGRSLGGTVHLTAKTNADLTSTPWSLGIVDDRGHLIGQPCKSGSACSGDYTVTGEMPNFTAAIGAVPVADAVTKVEQLISKIAGPTSLVNVQARSTAVKPKRMLWGVDSCKSFLDGDLYSHITGILGAPEFWGRYLTDAVCPPLSSAEVAAAHARHMGILPIYNERDCSNVSGYDTGRAYAAEAVAAAHAIGLPLGKGIAIDIEPSGDACPGAANLDTGLIHGWYDGMVSAGYAPIYYGSGLATSEFATQWCYTVAALPYIGERSYLWSFQPSLLGGYKKSNAPGFAPAIPPGCTAYVHAWQYQIGSSSWAAPDVDQDEATSDLPLWFP
jgi:hypothetical protein